jgi:hypothetical protein
MTQKRMRSELVQMKLEVREERSLMQQLHRTTLKKNLNPIWIK